MHQSIACLPRLYKYDWYSYVCSYIKRELSPRVKPGATSNNCFDPLRTVLCDYYVNDVNKQVNMKTTLSSFVSFEAHR